VADRLWVAAEIARDRQRRLRRCQPLGQLLQRLDALGSARRSSYKAAMDPRQRERLAALLAYVYKVVRHLNAFWESLDQDERATLRAFFASTKGDPRVIMRRPATERSEIVAIVRKGVAGLRAANARAQRAGS
jgi:hypothetical protein